MTDYFSRQAAYYVRYRPGYPEPLFTYLAGLCDTSGLAWDCATGNGQAAVALSKHFSKVIATDKSAEQVSRAEQAKGVEYRVEPAEHSSLDNGSVSLITAATAVHWFDIPAFYAEADRVLKPGGLLAVWSYAGCRIDPKLDKILDRFAFEILSDYWPPETRLNWKEKYETLPFPYRLISNPSFENRADYTLDALFNYLYSWSGVQQYINQRNQNPINLIRKELSNEWGDAETSRTLYWPLFLKCGYKP